MISVFARKRIIERIIGKTALVYNPVIFWNIGKKYGGEGGIRTHDGLSPMPVFKTGAFNRSATSPSWYGHHSDVAGLWLKYPYRPVNEEVGFLLYRLLHKNISTDNFGFSGDWLLLYRIVRDRLIASKLSCVNRSTKKGASGCSYHHFFLFIAPCRFCGTSW